MLTEREHLEDFYREFASGTLRLMASAFTYDQTNPRAAPADVHFCALRLDVIARILAEREQRTL